MAELPGLAGSLALSFICLAVVCLLAYLGLRWLSRRAGGGGGGAICVRARCVLEPRRSVYLLEVAGRFFLVGVGEGPMAVLAEVDGREVKEDKGTGRMEHGKFSGVLARALGKARP